MKKRQYYHFNKWFKFTIIKVKNLNCDKKNNWSYNNLQIIQVAANNPYFQQSLIIMDKNNLPSITHHEIDGNIKSKYHLKEIDSKNNIYTPLIDLNENEVLRNEMENKNKICNLNIFHKTEIRYKTPSQYIIIKIHNQFQNRGAVNKLEDIND